MERQSPTTPPVPESHRGQVLRYEFDSKGKWLQEYKRLPRNPGPSSLHGSNSKSPSPILPAASSQVHAKVLHQGEMSVSSSGLSRELGDLGRAVRRSYEKPQA